MRFKLVNLMKFYERASSEVLKSTLPKGGFIKALVIKRHVIKGGGESLSCEGEEMMGVLAKALLGRTVKMFIKGIKNNTQRANKIRQRLIFYNKIV